MIGDKRHKDKTTRLLEKVRDVVDKEVNDSSWLWNEFNAWAPVSRSSFRVGAVGVDDQKFDVEITITKREE